MRSLNNRRALANSLAHTDARLNTNSRAICVSCHTKRQLHSTAGVFLWTVCGAPALYGHFCPRCLGLSLFTTSLFRLVAILLFFFVVVLLLFLVRFFSFLFFRAFWPFPSDFLPLFYRGSRRLFLFLLLSEPSSSLASLVPKNDTVARSRRRCRDAFFSERKDDESSLSCSPSSRATSPYLGSCVKC